MGMATFSTVWAKLSEKNRWSPCCFAAAKPFHPSTIILNLITFLFKIIFPKCPFSKAANDAGKGSQLRRRHHFCGVEM